MHYKFKNLKLQENHYCPSCKKELHSNLIFSSLLGCNCSSQVFLAAITQNYQKKMDYSGFSIVILDHLYMIHQLQVYGKMNKSLKNLPWQELQSSWFCPKILPRLVSLHYHFHQILKPYSQKQRNLHHSSENLNIFINSPLLKINQKSWLFWKSLTSSFLFPLPKICFKKIELISWSREWLSTK